MWSSRFDAAVAAAERGWPVIPLAPFSKIPVKKRWESIATTDRALLEQWWSIDPDRNVGIACGPAGLVVIDLDSLRAAPSGLWADLGVRHGREVLALLAQWAHEPDPIDTYTVLTPRGEHRYFLAPPDRRLRNTTGASGRGLGPAVDVRAWGGAVTAAGSLRHLHGTAHLYRPHPDRPIMPMPLPDFLITLLTPPPPRPRAPIQLVPGGARLDAYVAAAIDGETTKVALASPGGRADTVFKAAAALGELVGAHILDAQVAEDALMAAAAVHDGIDRWTPREASRHIRNGIARGRTNARPLSWRAA